MIFLRLLNAPIANDIMMEKQNYFGILLNEVVLIISLRKETKIKCEAYPNEILFHKNCYSRSKPYDLAAPTCSWNGIACDATQ